MAQGRHNESQTELFTARVMLSKQPLTPEARLDSLDEQLESVKALLGETAAANRSRGILSAGRPGPALPGRKPSRRRFRAVGHF